ncbi:LysE/ArgO family amino acid transporter [Cocleimonas flava]|uniref:L-lysine exporter family protein LysE/ArgO n=1 Tax=Cocleimonas flava TaxID=634765 RepID=A0A4R1F317_9GAMM|nr:LysE/ArgO family amino acid transporter [Cocleimonas flava]TCJ88597.1 L-lysine exporter family protein LysE/ArgO [Cocleimonas flava]
MSIFFTGLILGASLIIAIGAQNAYVLKQGLIKRHIFIICLICALSDAILIVIGTSGLGKFVHNHPDWLKIITWLGATYLIIFGLMSLRSAFKSETLEIAAADGNSQNLRKVVTTVLALTFLNPHVYLDTVLLIGSIASPYSSEQRLYFTVGAVCASFIWFFSLGYGARLLAPVFAKPNAWKFLNILIGLVMFSIAYQLITTDFAVI